MTWLTDLIHNPFFITSVSSWAIAQVLKVIINFIVTKELSWERLFGDGGMPSGHSATVSSLAMFSALVYGTGSFQFAVCGILAIIVCHDAIGVRLETGKQAILLNELMEEFRRLSKAEFSEVVLKEFVGHTMSQVIVGVFIGFINAFVMYRFLF